MADCVTVVSGISISAGVHSGAGGLSGFIRRSTEKELLEKPDEAFSFKAAGVYKNKSACFEDKEQEETQKQAKVGPH